MEQELHVIFGAGQVGAPLAQALLKKGKRVRVVRRGAGVVAAGAELMQGDAGDARFCQAACAGAAVVYHCMNPAYSTNLWSTLLPRYMGNLISAAGGIGARLVVLDNLYMLGRTGGRPMNEDTRPNPCSRKGEIRALVAERLFEMQRQGNVRAVCGRAADFYGPGGRLTFFGDYFWKPVLAGKAGMSPVNAGTAHTYHYIPDVAQGLATLGCAEESTLVSAPLWMLPCQPAVPTREMTQRFAAALGHEIPLNEMPRWLLNALGLAVPMVREIKEMAYQWDEPFVVDDSRFRATFNIHPVEADEAAQATVAWARQTYMPRIK
ncbi:MAG: NAD-dependent epimerase/dehydratase family protein [Nitrosomonadales bacterium]|nr:NAD-dependent epimerase/dehydratase family protein [Nitrosomonadales bacterium]